MWCNGCHLRFPDSRTRLRPKRCYSPYRSTRDKTGHTCEQLPMKGRKRPRPGGTCTSSKDSGGNGPLRKECRKTRMPHSWRSAEKNIPGKGVSRNFPGSRKRVSFYAVALKSEIAYSNPKAKDVSPNRRNFRATSNYS